MLATWFRLTTVLAVTMAVWNMATPSWAADKPKEPQAGASAGSQAKSPAPVPLPMDSGPAALGGFNYYVHPGQAGMVGAQLYVSPRPTPPLVGHTYITYPPLAPHQFMYHHHDSYRTYNPGSGWTRTRARYH
jgi:hypothetical protein